MEETTDADSSEHSRRRFESPPPPLDDEERRIMGIRELDLELTRGVADEVFDDLTGWQRC